MKRPRVKVKAVEEAIDNLEQLEVKANLNGPRSRLFHNQRAIIDSALQPLYNNIKKYSGKVASELRRADFNTHTKQKVWNDKVRPFKEWMDKLDVNVQEGFHKLLLNEGISKNTMKLAKELGGEQHFKAVQSILKEIMDGYKGAGYKITSLEDYFPRNVRDLAAVRSGEQQDILQKALASARKAKGKKLTDKDEARVLERMLSFDPRFSSTSGSLQRRKIPEITDEQLMNYTDPVTTLYYYVNNAAEDLATRTFFKNFGHKPGKKGLDPTGADLDDSIDSLVQHMSKNLPNHADRTDLVKLLRSRFANDIHGTHGIVQASKNISYAGTLGNYWSAMTQLGDLIFAVHKYGIADTVASILGPKVTHKDKLGLDKAMQELHSGRGVTSKIADWAFKWGGFDAVDRFGKNINMNASLRNNKKLALKDPTAFKKKWSTVFGKETDQVLEELSNAKLVKDAQLSDNIHLMLWNDLADTQPIGLSEMPQKYLDHPNGRIFYAYKTFTLKQLNYMRDIATKEGKSGLSRASNLTYFGAMFVLANSSIDAFKDFMSGKDIDIEDKLIDNIAGLIGSNKYAIEKGRGLGDIITEYIKPVPVVQALTLANLTPWDTDLEDVTKQVPSLKKPVEAVQNWMNK
jgi:hypothetical protein